MLPFFFMQFFFFLFKLLCMCRYNLVPRLSLCANEKLLFHMASDGKKLGGGGALGTRLPCVQKYRILKTLNGSSFTISYYTPASTATIHHFLLHSSIHCYHSPFPTSLQHSLLPFTISYYTPAFTATIHHFLLHASIHCYHPEFPTSLQHSLLPFTISYYTPAFTATIRNSLYTSFQHSLLLSIFFNNRAGSLQSSSTVVSYSCLIPITYSGENGLYRNETMYCGTIADRILNHIYHQSTVCHN